MRALRLFLSLAFTVLIASGCAGLIPCGVPDAVCPTAQPATPPPTPAAAIVYPPNDGFQGVPSIVTLPAGTRVSRYGGYFDAGGTFQDKGNFVAPEDVPFEQRALPKQALAKPLTVYEVTAPIEGVRSGPAAPWFDEPGLGLQYQLPLTIQDYLDQGKLKVISRTIPPPPAEKGP